MKLPGLLLNRLFEYLSAQIEHDAAVNLAHYFAVRRFQCFGLALSVFIGCLSGGDMLYASISPSLSALLALKAAGHDLEENLAEELTVSAPDASDDCFIRIHCRAGSTVGAMVESACDGRLSPAQALVLLVLSNEQELGRELRLEKKISKDITLKFPRPGIIGPADVFFRDLSRLLSKTFDERLSTAGFDELEQRFHVLHDLLLPVVYKPGDGNINSALNPQKQLVFDFGMITSFREINDLLYKLLSQRGSKQNWEPAWKIHDRIISVQQQMTAALDDPHITVKDAISGRLDGYFSRFRGYLEEQLRRRRRKLAVALSRDDIEAAREVIESILYQVKPALGGIVPLSLEETLYDDLCRTHKKYIAPVTRERSLAFTNNFTRLAALLAPPSNADNYKLGFKISDVEFQFLKHSGSVVFHTDCSGFIGRIYRELARIAGLDMKKFVVHDSGVIGSIYMIEPKCSRKLTISKGSSLNKLLQGDFFYFERKIRGKRQRHVVFFDRLIRREAATLVSIWEASPGGVKHRTRSMKWIMKRITSPYGYPRNGAYRLKDMDKIDAVLEKRGFIL